MTVFRRSRAASSVLLILALSLPAIAAVHREQRVVREDQGWVQESSGPLGDEKLLEVTRVVGSVRVTTGAKTGTYLLRLHSQEHLEKDARLQFSTFHVAVGRGPGVEIFKTIGPIEYGAARRAYSANPCQDRLRSR